MINKDSLIYVAGHTGMVGSSILRNLEKNDYTNILYRTHSDLDLTNQFDTISFFKKNNPEYVFIAAAKVGGILANNTYRGQFLYENLTIQNNIIHSSHVIGVKKLMFLGSACIYPKYSTQPIKEEYLLNGQLEPTNEPYAVAKIAGIKLCQTYFEQYGRNFVSGMPNNLYGPKDNYDLETSHVLPALIRKFHEGKVNDLKQVSIWGTGNPKREFLHVDDLSEACLYIMNEIDAKDFKKMSISHINIGSGKEISIRELAFLIKEIVGFKGRVSFDKEKPDGTQRKLLDSSLLQSMGWSAKISFKVGIKKTYDSYISNFK